jgi:hypothetical protein
VLDMIAKTGPDARSVVGHDLAGEAPGGASVGVDQIGCEEELAGRC